MFINRRFWLQMLAIALSLWCWWSIPSLAQLPLLPKIELETFKLDRNLNNTVISACVRLDGRCLFELSDQKSNLAARIRYTEDRLADIKQMYLQQNSDDSTLEVVHRGDRNLQSIYVILNQQELPVLTFTERDANIHGVSLEHHAQLIADKIKLGLQRTLSERQPTWLRQQAKLAIGILVLMLLGNWLLIKQLKGLNRERVRLTTSQKEASHSIDRDLEHRKKFNLHEVQQRLLQLAQVTLWLGGSLLILSLFPQTRLWQLWIVTLIRIPLRVAIVIAVGYILIRLSYAAIARINAAINNNTFANNYVFQPDTTRRLQVRVNTFSRLFRGIVTCFWVGIAIFVSLSILGLNIAPFLAGAGVLGLAFSFASQNIIKDTINGLLIILEDQYAVGDVISVDNASGMVENLSLRITQLRDGEGRLITIPNSTIAQVANHSNGWSRSDLKIPFTHQTNVDRAIEIIERIATEMYQDCDCREKIIEPPQILGVEDFGAEGFVVRLWFKTEPLKQWEVSREFRRRVKNAFEENNIPAPLPQQRIWLDGQ